MTGRSRTPVPILPGPAIPAAAPDHPRSTTSPPPPTRPSPPTPTPPGEGGGRRAPPMPATRIARGFPALKAKTRAGLVPYIVAGDPDAAISLALLPGLPQAGADLIELGMPFSDPMADGPAI